MFFFPISHVFCVSYLCSLLKTMITSFDLRKFFILICLIKLPFSFSFQCTRSLQIEYEQLKEQHLRRGINPLAPPPDSIVSPQHASEDAELIAEAKLLRQHKGRLEARMQILEDHNKQLESQLHRLRQLLEQVNMH